MAVALAAVMAMVVEAAVTLLDRAPTYQTSHGMLRPYTSILDLVVV